MTDLDEVMAAVDELEAVFWNHEEESIDSRRKAVEQAVARYAEAERARADRLAAALRARGAEVQMLGQRIHDTWHKGSTFGDCEEATCALARAIVRAALADSPKEENDGVVHEEQ